MLDNDLIREIIAAIKTGLATYDGLSDVPVKQTYQPTNQGIETGPAVYLFKIGDKRIGSPHKLDKWDQENSVMVHTYRQWYETTFQISALSIQNPREEDSLTASDLVNTVSAILQSDATLGILRANDIGVLRVMDIRNPYFVDDKDRYEANPSFDFIVTHEQVVVSTSNVVETIEYNIKRV